MKFPQSKAASKILLRIVFVLGLILGLPGGFVWLTTSSTVMVNNAEGRTVHPARVQRGANVGPHVHPHRHVVKPVPRHIGRPLSRRTGPRRVILTLPKDCEEVPGEDATYYCEGVYYRAYYQGNRVVYGPEALEE